MSSIVQGMNAERTNRWLLIGAAVLAVVAGALVFLLLGNVGGDDDGGGGSSVAGNNSVLVAKQTIAPGTKVTADMFEVARFDEQYLVPNPVSDASAIVGQVSLTEILKGQQVSTTYLAIGRSDDRTEALTFKVPEGMLGYAMSVSEDKIVGGLIEPTDRVDLIVSYTTKATRDAQVKQLHVELLAENVLVLARAQETPETVPVVGADGKPVDRSPTDQSVDSRQEGLDPDPGARTVTLALTPAQVLTLTKFLSLEDAEIRVALRRFGNDQPFGQPPIVLDVFD